MAHNCIHLAENNKSNDNLHAIVHNNNNNNKNKR